MADEKKKTVEAGDADAALPARRVGPIEFFQQVRREAKKVTWPSWKETWLTTMMVFIMVGLTMVFFFFVDFALQYGESVLVGAKRLF
jgi:preprotein translocase subunit SecE